MYGMYSDKWQNDIWPVLSQLSKGQQMSNEFLSYDLKHMHCYDLFHNSFNIYCDIFIFADNVVTFILLFCNRHTIKIFCFTYQCHLKLQKSFLFEIWYIIIGNTYKVTVSRKPQKRCETLLSEQLSILS